MLRQRRNLHADRHERMQQPQRRNRRGSRERRKGGKAEKKPEQRRNKSASAETVKVKKSGKIRWRKRLETE